MKKPHSPILIVAAIIVLAAQRTPSNPASTVTPPVAKRMHTENHINGGNLVDDYRWLREKSNPEVARYLEAENAYTDSIM
jgi:oligopeptidase B